MIIFMTIIMETSISPVLLMHYIFSMDHKIIARQFLITGIIWAIIGAAMSVVFRMQLGFPEESLTWIKPFLR
jgi:cytochrome c oxidase subunit I